MKNILITGGAGFIGSNFIHHILNHRSTLHITNLDDLTYSGNLDNLKDIQNLDRYHFIKGNICDLRQSIVYSKNTPLIQSSILRQNRTLIVRFRIQCNS